MFGFWGFRACLWRSALFFFICQQRIGFDYLLEQPRSSSLPCLYLNQINIQWKSHEAANPHPHITGLTKFYLNQIIIHLTWNGNNMGNFWFYFYLNQIKWYLVWEFTSVFQSTLIQHIGYANHRLPKIGEFFILSPQGKQNFWKCNILSDKWLWFLVIFGRFWSFLGVWGGLRGIYGEYNRWVMYLYAGVIWKYAGVIYGFYFLICLWD